MEIGNIVKIGKKYCKNCQDYKDGECKLFGGKAFNACVFYKTERKTHDHKDNARTKTTIL